MILSYEKVMITNNFRLQLLFLQNVNINKHKWRICPLS